MISGIDSGSDNYHPPSIWIGDFHKLLDHLQISVTVFLHLFFEYVEYVLNFEMNFTPIKNRNLEKTVRAYKPTMIEDLKQMTLQAFATFYSIQT